MKNSNNKKKINRTSNNKVKVPFNYRPIKYGAIHFPTASKAVVYLLKRTKYSQSEIARRCGVSQPCVCQLAATVTRK